MLSVNSVWVRDDHELSIVSDLLPKFLCVEVRQALPKKGGNNKGFEIISSLTVIKSVK